MNSKKLKIGSDEIPLDEIASVSGYWKNRKYAIVEVRFKSGLDWHWKAEEDDQAGIDELHRCMHTIEFESFRRKQENRPLR